MKTNLLVAIKNIINNPSLLIEDSQGSSNRVNSVGESLEGFVRDIFCGIASDLSPDARNKIYSDHFSYIGNKNNPPDLIIKNGDAVEIKKIEGLASGIALNSSYPKSKLFSTSSMITDACRNCEAWDVKDMLYVVGVIKNKNLISLWFVYGDCYAAEEDVYKRIKDKISGGVNEIEGIEFAETNELGRVNKVDPLGITYLRIRGMWHIENPSKVFDYLPISKVQKFSLNALMTEEKYNSFSFESKRDLERLALPSFSIQNVEIKSPNNPAKLLKAKLISFGAGE
jgi:hypothetical protein